MAAATLPADRRINMAFTFAVDEFYNDFRISNGDMVLAQGSEAVREQIRIALNTELGEWFLNQFYGLPYYATDFTMNNDDSETEAILGTNISAARIEAYFIAQVYSVPGVRLVTNFLLSPISNNRAFSIQMNVIVEENVYNGFGTQRNVDVSLTVGV